jgi:uncharacterized protein (TIGR03435 family)
MCYFNSTMRGATSWRTAVRTVALTCVAGLTHLASSAQSLTSTAAGPGQPTPRLEFEAASVKPNKSGDVRRGMGPAPGGRFTAVNVPLRELIAFAYGVPNARASLQVVGGPRWMDTERFDVEAVALGGALTPAQASPMVRALLEDRFRLSVHRETREIPVYYLAPNRADRQPGPRLRASAIDCEARRAARGRGAAPASPPSPSPPIDPATIRPTCGLRLAAGRFAGDGVDMSRLADGLAPFVGRLVIDRTGLTGSFDIDLDWTPDGPAPSPNDPAPFAGDREAPGLMTAIREQLGLRLERARGPIEVVAIDAIQPLDAN